MIELILKVIIAHILGDFLLQSDQFIKDISTKKYRSPFLFFHFLIHFVLLWAFTSLFWASLALSTIHILIDIFTKVTLIEKMNQLKLFILDQILHLSTIGVFVYNQFPFHIDWVKIFNIEHYKLILVICLITYVSAIFIRIVMENLFNHDWEDETKYGNKNAGKYIGILERLFVFAFIINGFWEGIGFLLASKSIIRFGELKENKDIKLTEYILLGTFLSFGISIFWSIIYLKFK